MEQEIGSEQQRFGLVGSAGVRRGREHQRAVAAAIVFVQFLSTGIPNGAGARRTHERAQTRAGAGKSVGAAPKHVGHRSSQQ